MASDDSYQRYIQLLNKQQSIRRRLSAQISFTTTMMSPTTPEGYPAMVSPMEYRCDSPYYASQSYVSTSRPVPASYSYDPYYSGANVTYDGGEVQHTEDVKALYEINKQIKTTLTELLNSQSVKCNKKFRTWVQTRLMEAEREMKHERRRRSSCSVDRSTVNNIADGMEQVSMLRMMP